MGFSIIVTIIAFGIMVMLHEAGHFFVAKRFGVTVHEFSIGMGPLIFKWGKDKKEHPNATQYSIRLLPLGGYVKLEDEGQESDDPKAFSNIHPLKRMAILVAGATMNILLGLLCFIIINTSIKGVITTKVESILEDSAAEKAGLMPGDEIIKLDNTRVNTTSDVNLFMMLADDEVEVTYLRNGEKDSVVVTPKTDESGRKLIGFTPVVKQPNPLEIVEYSLYDTRYVVRAVVYSLKMLFTGEAKVNDLSGPVGIVGAVEETTQATEQYGWFYIFLNLLNLFAMISVNLGVFNLLPFPGLDGGSIIIALFELVTGKKPKEEVVGIINLIGLALILGLGIYVMYSDIVKLI